MLQANYKRKRYVLLCMVYMYVVYGWCICMVYMYGVYGWCICMVYVDGVYVWCICMVHMDIRDIPSA
jgi:hypothetical protein